MIAWSTSCTSIGAHGWLQVASRFRGMAARLRASTRAVAAIGEGFGRFKHKDFARFVRISKASEVEILDHLLEAHTRGYLDAKELDALDHLTRKAIKAANGLIRYLETTPDRDP